ncbi:hypothetical protein BAE44_0025165 [Dichanthelium oligosanthes]|uniref:DUF7595 domain-containing protein n=1 Tax=Dichanthelium oligosanthes TaxID=888268 RepID=A0A1E5ULR1_9POAL|nr:hypothetical protein BAE44_0025165 [Dichanthelium oligosanthes]
MEAREPLPNDLLLEIAARADIKTVVRCAAVCKPPRRAIIDPDFSRFRRRLAVHPSPADGGFDPDHLIGFSYWLHGAVPRTDDDDDSTHHVEIPQSPRPRASIHPSTSSLLAWLEPLAARDGLFVLLRPSSRKMLVGAVLCVFDALTGEVTRLPSLGVQERRPVVGSHRAVAEAPYRLLPRGHAVVLGRTVHWLSEQSLVLRNRYRRYVLSLDVDAAVAAKLQLPLVYCDTTQTRVCREKLLLAAVGGRLSLLAVEGLEVSVWTLTTPATDEPAWNRDLVIHTLQLERQPAAGLRSPVVMIEGFGERSGAVILRMDGGDGDCELIRLDLGTKEATTLLEERATMDKIKEAHKRAMVANHPDAGGSHYVASKINEAKDILMGKSKSGASVF